MKLDQTLKAWRKNKKLTQGQAAPMFGASVRTYQKWEQGTNAPRGAGLAAVLERIKRK